MSKIKIPIRGMHCRSCEILIEENLKEITGVSSANVNHRTGEAVVSYSGNAPGQDQIEKAIQKAGYEVGSIDKLPWLSNNPDDYFRLAFAGGILLALYFVANGFGLFDINVATNSGSLWVVMLLGLVAGFSTCMALVGGIVLALSARHSELHSEATRIQKFRPHVFFNAGRIIGYALFGGLVGLLGSVIQFSTSLLGVLTVVVGLVMILLGLKLIEIFPALKYKTIALPKSISRVLGIKKEAKEYSHKGSFMAGTLTFFLPCGFTQAMQLYAVSTGSFTEGALIMSAFALGTAPGLLGVGGLSSIFKGLQAKIFFMVAGLAVILLGGYNIWSGSKLVSLPGSSIAAEQIATENKKPEIKVIKTTYNNATDIVPSIFTVKKGEPVRIEVTVNETAYGCMSTIGIPGLYNKMQLLEKGKTIVMQFTPTRTGGYPITCAMGVPRGSVKVI
jgi:sulfite exporter TauE/SafE/copper chaperone CopZ